MENPEPVEPTMVSVPGGLYCIVHGVMDCTLPFCWRCGNHLMDSFDRCADPKCRASNDPQARAIVERVKAEWTDRPAPLEVLALSIGLHLGRSYVTSIPSLPGEPGGGGVPEPSVPATGAAG